MNNPHGQWRTQAGYGLSRTLGYDNAGRLTAVQDTPTGQACITRRYAFDVNSNRTSLSSTPAATDGTCSASTTATTVGYGYDAADRLQPSGVHAGLAYDLWGRTRALPAADSSKADSSGPTTVGYLNTDLVATTTNAGITRAWTMDAAGRRRTMTGTAGNKTDTSHYDGTDDNPAWIAEGDGGATVYTQGLAGDLTATSTLPVSGEASTNWQLANLHGDIFTTLALGGATPGACPGCR